MNTSQTPWKVIAGKSDESAFNIFDAEGNFIPRTDAEHSQMAAFVQRSVNSHEALVKALKATLSAFPPSQYRSKAHLPPALEQDIRTALSLANS